MADLENKIGCEFIKQRHGQTQTVKLDDVRKKKVKLTDIATGNLFTLPIEKFQKFYQEAS